MKTRLTVCGAAALALTLAGCAGATPEQDSSEETEGGAAGGGGDTRVLRFGHVYDPAHPNETCGAVRLNEILAENDSGLSIESYPAAQLGSEEEMLEQLADGSLDMSIAGPSFLGVWHEPAAVFDAAYAFTDVDHFDQTVNGEIGEQVWDGLREEAGLQVLGSWYYGTRHITANVPVRGPDDLAGVKLRVPNAPLYLDNTEAMGGTATPVALSEVYLGLQQGVVDAQENPIPTIATNRFQEVQDYLNLTGHIVQGTMVVIGEQTMEGLEPEQQEALQAAVDETTPEVRACIEEQEQEILEEWRESGVIEIVEDIDFQAFADAAREQLPAKYPGWEGLYEQIQSEG
jgi:TRAP-type transport system periplasmic protein